MTSHGYEDDEDDVDNVDDGSSWNPNESFAMRRGPRRLRHHTVERPASLLWRMQVMTGVTAQNWNLNIMDLHPEIE